MGKYVQIGTAALRSPEGEFLPAEPIFREEGQRSPKAAEQSYIDGDVLADIFASKYKKFKEERKKCEKS